MRKVEAVEKNGKWGVLDNDRESVPFVYDNAKDAINEWSYFQELNTESEPHRRFLPEVSSMEFINEVKARYET